MIGRDEIALNAVDCSSESHCSSLILCGNAVEFRFNA
jgi:hypothetical protein